MWYKRIKQSLVSRVLSDKEEKLDKDKDKQKGEVSRRDFLVGAGAVVVGGAIGAAITYPLVKGDGGEVVTTTKTVSVPTTVVSTKTEGGGATVTTTKTEGGGATVTNTVTSTKTVGEVQEEPEETFLESVGLCGFGVHGALTAVDVKGGKIVRIRPLHYDWKYTNEELAPTLWSIEARGKVYKPGTKTLPSYFGTAYKKMIYSPNRILYPLKRIDWDPNANPETGRNTQNRGKSKFKRISWDEALDTIASEMRRVIDTYGPSGILASADGHGEGKSIHTARCHPQVLAHLGGYTFQVRNPDSWEGWYWGAKHMWGMTPNRGIQSNQDNAFNDVSLNTELLLWWGGDPETTTAGFQGMVASRECFWFTELGIKQLWICPDLNYGAAVHADKWIPVLPNTDSALQLAISYTWITEGTYDQGYLGTHTVGFDVYKAYVLGEEDGVPKTPTWASPLCGVPVWTIKALAKQWASKNTSTRHYFGGSYIRGPYSHEACRMEVINLAMQGLGKPGRNCTRSLHGQPEPLVRASVRAGVGHAGGGVPPVQLIPKTLIHKAILNETISHYGTTGQFQPTEDQYVKYTYPWEGQSRIHMMWTDSPCLIGCWNGGAEMVEAFRSPEIEFVLVQHQWMQNDCLFGDIILPVSTKFEQEDIAATSFPMTSSDYVIVNREGKSIEPVGESMSDYDISIEVAKRMGVYEELTGGKTPDEWVKFAFDFSGVADMISWEELMEKQYYVVPTQPNWKEIPAGLSKFYEDPENNPLVTPTGLLELEATGLVENFPDDPERAPIPKWVVGGPGSEWEHDESQWGERYKKYSMLLITNHPRWRHHVFGDDISWLREIPTCKVKGPDGYMYEPVWINPVDAAPRGIDTGDIVKLYNERGAVLGALVMERVIPGAVYMDHGARCDPIVWGEVDRGGSINMICPSGLISKNCAGMATSGFLVEFEKLDPAEMEGWRKNYPEAFERDYDPAYGPLLNAWVEGGM